MINDLMNFRDRFISFPPLGLQKIIRYLKQWHILPSFIHDYDKDKIITNCSKEYNINILVETGTFLGDMIAKQLPYFKKIYSIELSESLYKQATVRFKNEPKVNLIQGDSGKELFSLIPKIKERSIFWLDGHFSSGIGITAKSDKNTLILKELEAIFQSMTRNHIVIIDDARYFGNEPDYPTVKELYKFILKHRTNSKILYKKDTIQVFLKD